MMKSAVQQIMLGKVCGDYDSALSTLKTIKNAGYDGIELNGFMIRPTSLMVRTLTYFAGMPTGKGGKLDWRNLIAESGLEVTSIHEDLGTLENDLDSVIKEAKTFNTNRIVITGMYRFDYLNRDEVLKLCSRMNVVGEKLAKENIELLYHNHNVEFLNYSSKDIYGMIIDNTDKRYVNFELDSFWIADAGIDPVLVMKRLGERMKLYHITDRGARVSGKIMTPIVKQDSMELGKGNMNLDLMINTAKENGVDTIVLESHKNWVDNSPIKSLIVSSEFLKEYK